MARVLTGKASVKSTEKPKILDTRKRVTMYATAAHPFLKVGEATVITTVQAKAQKLRGLLADTEEEATATIPEGMREDLGAAKTAEKKGKKGKDTEAEDLQ